MAKAPAKAKSVTPPSPKPKWAASKIEKWPVERLKPYERNARTHPERQIKQLRSSLLRFGFTIPLLVRADGTLIAGHGRLEAAKAENYTSVPVIVANGWSEEDCRAYTLLDNKYYFDWLYTTVITGFVKGPLARASGWVNTHVIDGVVNGVGHGAVGGGRWVYDKIDQTVVDGAVDGIGAGASGSGGVLRRITSGHIQQYAAPFFAAVAVLAGIFVVLIG